MHNNPYISSIRRYKYHLYLFGREECGGLLVACVPVLLVTDNLAVFKENGCLRWYLKI